MRIRRNEKKRQRVLRTRNIDFASLYELFDFPYVEDQRSDDPEQYRILGFAKGKLVSFIIEYRTDSLGEFIWVVTAWNATGQERDYYAKATK